MKKMIIVTLALYLPIQIFGAQVSRLTPHAQLLRTSTKTLRDQGTQLIQRVPNSLGTGAIRGFASKPQNLGYWAAFRNRFNNWGNQLGYYMPQSMRNWFAQNRATLKDIGEVAAFSTATGTALGAGIGAPLALTSYVKKKKLKEDLDQLKEAKGSLSEIHKKTREFAGWTAQYGLDKMRKKLGGLTDKVNLALKNYRSDNDTNLSDLYDSINELKQDPELAYRFVYKFKTPAQLEDLEKIIRNNQQLPPNIEELLRIIVEGAVFDEELGEQEDIKSNYPHLSSALNRITAEYSK